MSTKLFISLLSGLLLSMAILGGVIIGIETSVIAKIFGLFLLIICPITSMFLVQINLTQEE